MSGIALLAIVLLGPLILTVVVLLVVGYVQAGSSKHDHRP